MTLTNVLLVPNTFSGETVMPTYGDVIEGSEEEGRVVVRVTPYIIGKPHAAVQTATYIKGENGTWFNHTALYGRALFGVQRGHMLIVAHEQGYLANVLRQALVLLDQRRNHRCVTSGTASTAQWEAAVETVLTLLTPIDGAHETNREIAHLNERLRAWKDECLRSVW